MIEPVETLSEREVRFERWRRRLGYFFGPLVFVGLWLLPVSGLSAPAHRLLAVMGLVITLWITEALPLAVTALFGPALCVVCGVSTEKEVFKSFGNPIIFLFLGSFVLAEGMLRHGLNRRVAFKILGLKLVGASPARVLVALGSITGLFSMWISNTTATAMMFPIALAILTEMARRQSELSGREVRFTDLRFGTALMLAVAFAASIGGMATPVGTPPNLIGISLIEQSTGVRITFFQWMALGTPLALVLLGFLLIYLNLACPAPAGVLGQSTQWLQEQKRELGPLSRGERNVLLAFGTTVGLWLLPGIVAMGAGAESPFYRWLLTRLPEGVCAVIGAGLLFVLPVDFAKGEFTATWREVQRIDWGTILLFGGGLALGEAMFATGLAKWFGQGLARLMHAETVFGLTFLFTVVAVLLTETTSNTATASMVVPVAIAVAKAAGVDPIPPALGACLGASLAFMLPVSTPPNAVVYGSGCVPLLQMLRHGVVLDVAGIAVILSLLHFLVPLVIR